MPRPCLTNQLQTAVLIDEGPLSHVLRHDARREACVRLADGPADLVLGLDGRRELETVISDAEATHGPDAPALLVRLLAELGDRGFLEGVGDPGPSADQGRQPAAGGGRPGFLLRPRRWRWSGAPEAIGRLHARGGSALVTNPAIAGYALISLLGLVAFTLVLARGMSTPLVVGGGLGLGVVCFIGGRAALVVVHELAHGLMLNRFGRRVDGAGISLVAIFPYAYVDTSSAWLECRRRRMAVSAAGPLSDLTLGGTAAIAALLSHGIAAEIFYQLTLAGYLAALLNLNPCLDRDGYYLLADALGLPGLRAAGLASLAHTISGRAGQERPQLRWYGIAVVVWSVLGSGLVMASLWGALGRLANVIPHDVSLTLLLVLWVLLLIPTGLLLGRPLAERARQGRTTGRSIETEKPAAVYVPLLPTVDQAPVVRLAHRVLEDLSLRERIRALGPPPGFEVLGSRELRSSVAGVVLAAGGESLALTHLVDAATPTLGHVADHVAANTSLDRIRSLFGENSSPPAEPVHIEPSVETPDASQPEPVIYQPPADGAGGPITVPGGSDLSDATTGGISVISSSARLDLPPWPGNAAGQVAVAHWMAAGAQAAGLPGELPVMAGLVESDLNNDACCNADSLGYFQMRESVWNFGPWTGYASNPELQLSWFIQQASSVQQEMIASGYADFGQHSSDWGTWVADVENPAAQYRYRYGLQLEIAQALLASPLSG